MLIPEPAIQYKYYIEIDNFKLFSLLNTSLDIDFLENFISAAFLHPANSDGQAFLDRLEKLSKASFMISVTLLDSNDNSAGVILKKCRMIKHSISFDVKSQELVIHEVKFKIIN